MRTDLKCGVFCLGFFLFVFTFVKLREISVAEIREQICIAPFQVTSAVNIKRKT